MTTSATARIRGMISIMRPSAWVWFDVLPALATLCTLRPIEIELRATLGLLCGHMFTDSAACVLNDIYDIETDSRSVEESRKRRSRVSGSISLRAAWYQFYVLAGLSVAIVAWLIPASLPAFICYWIILVAYSTPPVRLVGRPWACIPVWFLIGLSTYGCAALLVHKVYTPTSIVYLFAVGFMMGTSGVFAKDIRDWDNDAAGKRRTLVGHLGIRTSAILSMLAATAGTVGFLVLFLSGVSVCPRWAAIAGSVCALGWLWFTTIKGRRLLEGYDKDVAVAFYRGHLIAYSVLNLIIILGSYYAPAS